MSSKAWGKVDKQALTQLGRSKKLCNFVAQQGDNGQWIIYFCVEKQLEDRMFSAFSLKKCWTFEESNVSPMAYYTIYTPTEIAHSAPSICTICMCP